MSAQGTSYISDVFRTVRDLFAAVPDATPIMTGDQYTQDRGVGSGSRVLFVPDKRGQLGPPIEVSKGDVASISHGCDCYVRSIANADDDSRFDAAYALTARVLTALKRAAAGRIQLQSIEDSSPTKGGGDGSYGVELKLRFVYRHGVKRDDAIWNVPATNATGSPPDNDPDAPGTTYGTSLTTNGGR